MFSSLREFIEDVDKEGELRVVLDADWDIEIGVLTELLVQNRTRTPTVLCDRIKGYPEGFRVLINPLKNPRQMARALNLDPGISTKRELIDAWRKMLKGYGSPIPPQWVDSGPILENVDEKDKVDILKFPTPKWHELDGGRFIGTGCVVIQRDRDTEWINMGTYRVQVQDRNTISVYPFEGKDGDIIRHKYHSAGESCPVVVCAGQAPDLFLTASSTAPPGVCELDLVGALRGEPVRVVRGQLTGLPIPAEAEIALEGEWVPPEQRIVKEGPFGEWHGYYASGVQDIPAVEVKRVYYRRDPIILGMPPVKPPNYLTNEVITAARIWSELEAAGIPGVQAVNMLPAGSSRHLPVISIKTLYPGHSKQVGRLAASTRTGGIHGRFTIVVDDDIDIFDTEEVLWAVTTRCDPASDIDIWEDCWTMSLDPLLSLEKRQSGNITNSRAIIDATRPYHRKDSFPPVCTASEEWKQQVRAKWKELLGEADDK